MLKKIVLSFYVFFIAYEYWDPFGIAEYITLPKIMAILFFILCFFQSNTIKQFLVLSRYSIPFFVFIIYFFSISFFYSLAESTWISLDDVSSFFTLFLCILMYSCLLYAMQDQEMRETLLNTLKLSFISISILLLLGIGSEVSSNGRLSFFGCNSNTLGVYGIFCVFFAFMSGHYSLLYRAILLSCGLFLAQKSGSLTVVAVLPVILLGNLIKRLLSKKNILLIPLILLILVLITFLFYDSLILDEDSIISQRILNFEAQDYDTNKILSGRMEIWEYAKELFYSSPLTGVGQTVAREYMIERTGVNRAIHSLYMELLAKTGIIGFCLYLYPFVITAKKVYSNLSKEIDSFILIIILALILGKSGSGMSDKTIWLMFAYLVVSAEQLTVETSETGKKTHETPETQETYETSKTLPPPETDT